MTIRAVVMGVSGIGKSSVGAALADRLSAAFIDGDELHPAANVAKMARGLPLDDDDRLPWLRLVGAELAAAEQRGLGLVVACSALRRSYRDVVVGLAPTTMFVCLTASLGVVGRRLAARRDHFMPAALLDSQFAALELPDADEPAVLVDVDAAPGIVVERAAAAIATALPWR